MSIFINIKEVVEPGADVRCSCLQIDSEAHPGAAVVIGNLPHGYAFRPTNSANRDALMRWLHSLNYED